MYAFKLISSESYKSRRLE